MTRWHRFWHTNTGPDYCSPEWHRRQARAPAYILAVWFGPGLGWMAGSVIWANRETIVIALVALAVIASIAAAALYGRRPWLTWRRP